jgi:hypothetical protein
MDHHPISRSFPCSKALALIAACLVATVGCRASLGELAARATDEWTRTYPLDPKGEVQITNTNGSIEFEGVEGSMVEVRAERVARAATDAGARELLPRIGIKEDVKPDRVSIETERLGGIMIGVSFEVQYHVRVPKWALVRGRTVNGAMAIQGIDGRVVANSVNGAITGRELAGGVEANTVNGGIEIAMRSVGEALIDLRTVNGAVRLTLPGDAKANLSASCRNGEIDVAGLTLDLMGEQSRRRVRGRMNGGGTPIELNTVNGKIEVSAR